MFCFLPNVYQQDEKIQIVTLRWGFVHMWNFGQEKGANLLIHRLVKKTCSPVFLQQNDGLGIAHRHMDKQFLISLTCTYVTVKCATKPYN